MSTPKAYSADLLLGDPGDSHILFLTLYHKSEMADLAQKDIKALAGLVKGLK